MSDIEAASAETVADAKSPGEIVKMWLARLDMASKREETWRKRADEVIARYRDEKRESGIPRFNILWANTETLAAALYNRTPQPDVRRRFRDPDPVAKQAAQVIERSLSFAVDAYDFDSTMAQVIQDYLLPGRGQARVRYVPVMADDEVVYEEVRCEYVPWKMFRQGDGTREDKLTWKAFGGMMTREQLVAQFGEKGREVPLAEVPEELKDRPEEEKNYFKQTLVWEIWDKATKRVYVIAPAYKAGPLAQMEPPLNFENFFPCPPALMSIRTNDTLVPIPEFTLYQDQADEVDRITGRIDKLVEALKLRGVYDASQDELQNLLRLGDNELAPVNDWARFAEKGGLDGMIAYAPVEQIAKVVLGLYQQREQTKQIIYEITGISDIVRGATDPNETLGAQQLKGQYANMRMEKRITAVQHFARDLFRLKAEVIAEQFSVETLKAMTGLQLPDAPEAPAGYEPALTPEMGAAPTPMAPETDKASWAEVMAVLRNDGPRGFRIDIETDSTVMRDAADDQRAVKDFLEGAVGFVQGIAPAVQAGVVPLEAAKAILLASARRFKFGRDVEDALNQIGGEDGQAKQQQPQGPSPEQLAMQQKQAELAQQGQLKQAELQQTMAIEQAKLESAERIAMAKLQSDQGLALQKLEATNSLDMQKHAMTTEAAAKPTTMVQFDAKEQLGVLADQLTQITGTLAQQGENNQAIMLEQMNANTQAILGALEQFAAVVATPKRAFKDATGAWHVQPEPARVN